MKTKEPTDNQLIKLMKEVASEAKSKAVLSKKNLAQTILNEINIAQLKYSK